MGDGQAWLEFASTWLLDAAFAIMSGCVASLLLLERAGSKWARSRSQRVNRVLRRAAAIGVFAFALLLWATASAMAEEPLLAAGSSIGTVIAHSHIGHAWVVGAAALLATATLAMPRLTHGRSTVIAAGCATLFAASRSSMSHAGSSGELLPWLVDGLHLLATSVWAGAVVLAACIVLGAQTPAGLEERRDCARYVEALSTTATWSLAIVLVTGGFNAWRLASTPDQLAKSHYGEVLLAKLLLVALAAALGAVNRLRMLRPTLLELQASEPAPLARLDKFRRVLLVESVVLLAVLAFAALLATSAPPSAT